MFFPLEQQGKFHVFLRTHHLPSLAHTFCPVGRVFATTTDNHRLIHSLKPAGMDSSPAVTVTVTHAQSALDGPVKGQVQAVQADKPAATTLTTKSKILLSGFVLILVGAAIAIPLGITQHNKHKHSKQVQGLQIDPR